MGCNLRQRRDREEGEKEREKKGHREREETDGRKKDRAKRDGERERAMGKKDGEKKREIESVCLTSDSKETDIREGVKGEWERKGKRKRDNSSNWVTP